MIEIPVKPSADRLGYVRTWQVLGTSNKPYDVSMHRSQAFFSCSCPAWRFQKAQHDQRRDCQHVLQVKLVLSQSGAYQHSGLNPQIPAQPEQPAGPARRIRCDE